jgi:hypothetical protein
MVHDCAGLERRTYSRGRPLVACVALTRLTRIGHVEPTSAIEPWLVPVGLVVLVPPWIALVRLHDLGPTTGPGWSCR